MTFCIHGCLLITTLIYFIARVDKESIGSLLHESQCHACKLVLASFVRFLSFQSSMGSAGRSKKTGSSSKGGSALHKRGVRKKFRARHIDQVWEDVRKPKEVVVTQTHGPIGTSMYVYD